MRFTDDDGDTFWIEREFSDLDVLLLETGTSTIRFNTEDLDNMIKLFQAAKQYKI